MQIHPANYLTEVFTFITRSEGFNDGLPYFDIANKATLGYGVNVEGVPDYLRIVLQSMGLFVGKSDAQIAAIQQTFTNAISTTVHGQGKTYNDALKSSMDKAAQKYDLSSFPLITDTQATDAFHMILSGATIGGKVIVGKEATLDAILHNSLSHDSKEYVAVMSLYY
jgi:hypothetical protein